MEQKHNFDLTKIIDRLKAEKDYKNGIIERAHFLGEVDAKDILSNIDLATFYALNNTLNTIDEDEEDEYASLCQLKKVVFGDDLKEKLEFIESIRGTFRTEAKKVWISSFLKTLRQNVTLIAEGLNK